MRYNDVPDYNLEPPSLSPDEERINDLEWDIRDLKEELDNTDQYEEDNLTETTRYQELEYLIYEKEQAIDRIQNAEDYRYDY